MSNKILSLSPALIWKHFYAISQIPHPSGHEEQIRQYVLDFARQQGVECETDSTGNIVLRKPATPGMADRKGLILQAHLDMVPQKNNDKSFDFEKDALQPYIDGEWVTAEGTTLGADNGIGLAAILAVMESTDLVHGPIEGLFTLTEETGMVGAFGLSPTLLKGDVLLNLDSEDEGELCVGCAGGLNANASMDIQEESVENGYTAFEINVKGLKGGHSGTEIILQRGNSNKILFRFLKMAAKEFGLRLASVDGGGLRNAIPRESRAVAWIPQGQVQAFILAAKTCEAVYQKEIEAVDPNLSLTVNELKDSPASMLKVDSQTRLIDAVYGCPNGVIRMSDSMKGLVETSTNLARVVTDGGKAKVTCLLRSSVDSAKDDLAEMMSSVFELAGAHLLLEGGYSGWKPNMDSHILKAMRETYQSLFGKAPEVNAVHAGLECGIIGGKYPNLDMISFGPTICYPHSPDEKVEIASVEKFWKFLVATLENAPAK
jgi:dipeptidase D